jgi:hypothetical protein
MRTGMRMAMRVRMVMTGMELTMFGTTDLEVAAGVAIKPEGVEVRNQYASS